MRDIANNISDLNISEIDVPRQSKKSKRYEDERQGQKPSSSVEKIIETTIMKSLILPLLDNVCNACKYFPGQRNSKNSITLSFLKELSNFK